MNFADMDYKQETFKSQLRGEKGEEINLIGNFIIIGDFRWY